MSDLHDSDFDADLRDTMQRLAASGVPHLARAAPNGPTRRPSTAIDATVEPIEIKKAEPVPRPMLRRLVVAAAFVAFAGLLGALAWAQGEGANDAAQPSASTWSVMAPSPLAARAGSASAWTGEEWFIWGGRGLTPTGATYFDDGALYNPATDRWSTIAPSPLAASTIPDAIVVDGEVIVAGGSTDTQDSINAEIAAYNPERDTWRQLPAAPGPIVHLELVDGKPTATVLAGEVIAIARLDMTTNEWDEPVQTDLRVGLQPSYEARSRISSNGNDRYYAFGNRLHRNTLEDVVYELPDVLAFSPSVARDHEVIVVGQGGTYDNRGHLRTVVRYDTRTGESRVFESERPDPGLGAIGITDTAIVLMPNWSSNGGIEFFDLGKNTWVDVSAPPVDPERRQPVTIATGDQFLFWGGDLAELGAETSPSTGTGAVLTIESSFPRRPLK